ncbi:NAD-dependent epimerase/dehydratase family protein [Psychrobacillus sp. FSL W7-1493]|uniref:NAD-dependent epimerase/dehydratase family protein n=1 Tax=Psychrobacillus sp. FSL W7-1493 TaxID=2921552 RepID=UPI0030F519F0
MRVLITGGYGFIGSHVADRYFKEGYDVFILDDLSTGQKENITFKHKGYILSVEDSKCEEIFRAYHFDVVVHLAAQVSVSKSLINPKRDTEINAVGLVNILSLSQKYHAGKFIFASSAAVYGMNEQIPLQESDLCNPISPYGISKWLGESYCEKWRELYSYESVVLRFSNVYGPRQSDKGEGGVISIFLDRALEGENLEIFGDGEQTRDFIYVGDVADAIYRVANSHLNGIYNLSTNSEISINELVDLMKELHGEMEVTYGSAKDGDIYRSSLCNEKLVNALDWSPMYSMRRGLEQTYEWMEDKKIKQKTENASLSPKKFSGFYKKFQPYIENGLVFFLIAWLTLTNQVSVLNIADFSLFYIMIIGVIYGNRQSIIAVCLSIGLLIFEKLLEGREIISLTYDTSFLFQVALFLSMGLIVGYSIERKNNLIKKQKSLLDDQESRYSFLNDMHTELREVKKELQLRILNTGDGLGKMHYLLKELDTLDSEKIYVNSISVLQKMLKAKSVSIYKFSNDKSSLRLVTHLNSFELPTTLNVHEEDYVQQVIGKQNIFVNKKLLPQTPLMAACLSDGEEKLALITIDGIDFEHISLYHENLFKIVTEIIETALIKAKRFQELTEDDRFVSQTSVLIEHIFEEILKAKKVAFSKYQVPYLLLEVLADEESFISYANEISKEIEETDYIGASKDHGLFVLLSNTTKQAGQHVLSRLSEKGIVWKLVEGEL